MRISGTYRKTINSCRHTKHEKLAKSRAKTKTGSRKMKMFLSSRGACVALENENCFVANNRSAFKCFRLIWSAHDFETRLTIKWLKLAPAPSSTFVVDDFFSAPF